MTHAKQFSTEERAARFCRVSIRGRRSLVLDHFTYADGKYVSGVLSDGSHTTIQLRQGVRVEALGTSCGGELVTQRHECHCNRGAALAVEHSIPWAGRPEPKPVVVASKSIKSFADLRQIMGGR